MTSKQHSKSEETKRAILLAADRLFSEQGFDTVTMREIAREAGCSHTAIYIHFKDKEALLYQVAQEPLEGLRLELAALVDDRTLVPADRLRRLCGAFIQFGLSNRNRYAVLFMAEAGRVDEAEPPSAVNRLRNQLFGLLRQAVREYLPADESEERVLAFARLIFFNLHGIVETYRTTTEALPVLMERLGSTFDLSVEVLLAGIHEMVHRGVGQE